MNLTTIVVPNSDLLHNHQAEIAEALGKLGWVVHGDLDNLAPALDEAEILRETRNTVRKTKLESTSSAVPGGFSYILEREAGLSVD
jgi:UDP-N-acetylglucosamine transferase subunit ALG13